MDGIPINTADGYGDFQEIDPSAYRYVEVYKGANALRYGANSLGGAINFVTPTGRDASLFGASADIGSFGFHRLQSSSGGVKGPFDFFVTGSWQEHDGFRDHSWGESTRASANLGYQLSPNVETRFYFNVNDIMQRIPGSVTRSVALSSPDHGGCQQRGQRLAAQHRLLAHRQQDGGPPVAQHQRRSRRLRRRSPPDAPDLPVARLPVRGLRRLRPDDGRALHRRLQEPPDRRRQPPQRRDRQQTVPEQLQQRFRDQGRAAIEFARQVGEHVRLHRELLLLPARRGVRRRHAVPACDSRAHGSLPVERRSVRTDGVRRLEPENWPALERRSDLAGLCQRLAQRGGAELRRRLQQQRHRVHRSQRADRNHLRDSERAAAGPTTRGISRSTAPRSRTSCSACSAPSATAMWSTPIARCTRASRSVSAPPF